MKVEMIRTALGSIDGIMVKQYILGRTYDLPDKLANSFLKANLASLIPDDIEEEVPVGGRLKEEKKEEKKMVRRKGKDFYKKILEEASKDSSEDEDEKKGDDEEGNEEEGNEE